MDLSYENLERSLARDLERKLGRALDRTVNELFYALKLVRALRSGYLRLEVRTHGRWKGVTPEKRSWPESRVCAAFRSGSHLPLNVVLGARSPYRLQDVALRLAKGSAALERARDACERYQALPGTSLIAPDDDPGLRDYAKARSALARQRRTPQGEAASKPCLSRGALP